MQWPTFDKRATRAVGREESVRLQPKRHRPIPIQASQAGGYGLACSADAVALALPSYALRAGARWAL
eukprot:2397370-Lingulodinium_polyedra.AAC.1